MDIDTNVTAIIVALIAALPGIFAFISQRVRDERDNKEKKKIEECQELLEKEKMRRQILEMENEKLRAELEKAKAGASK